MSGDAEVAVSDIAMTAVLTMLHAPACRMHDLSMATLPNTLLFDVLDEVAVAIEAARRELIRDICEQSAAARQVSQRLAQREHIRSRLDGNRPSSRKTLGAYRRERDGGAS